MSNPTRPPFIQATSEPCPAWCTDQPMLDYDVAAWFSEECPLPRLSLLGPVTASAHGTIVPAIAKRKPYFVELLAYLALHPEGTTGSAVADAFSIGSSRAPAPTSATCGNGSEPTRGPADSTCLPQRPRAPTSRPA